MNTEKNSTVAKRYAKSILDTVNEGTSPQAVMDDLRNVETILKNSDDLYCALTNPVVSAKDKEEIIDAVFKQDTSDTVRNALKVLIQKNRFGFIYAIIRHFSELVDEINNTINVDVTCAIELDDQKKNKIHEKLKQKLQKIVNVDYKVNTSIIAGLVYKIGDDIIDASINHKIEELKKEIIK